MRHIAGNEGRNTSCPSKQVAWTKDDQFWLPQLDIWDAIELVRFYIWHLGTEEARLIYDFREDSWATKNTHWDLLLYSMMLLMEGFNWPQSRLPRSIATWILHSTLLTRRNANLWWMQWRTWPIRNKFITISNDSTVFPGYSDNLETREKCHWNQVSL